MPVVRVHLVGCLGRGMVALAQLYVSLGYQLSGCDERVDDPTARTAAARLRSLGVHIDARSAGHVDPGTDLVVYSAAVPAGHPDLVAARRIEVTALTRIAALAAALPRLADAVIAISGVTGKSSTATFVGQIYRALGREVHTYVGGDVPGLTDRDLTTATNRLAVVEACEVNRGMLELPATVAAVTSIYWGEHVSTYPTPASLDAAFETFLAQAGAAVLPTGQLRLAAAWKEHCARPETITFGVEPEADVRLAGMRATATGSDVVIRVRGSELRASTGLRGAHNGLNLVAALACHVAAGTPIAELCAMEYGSLQPPLRRIQQVGQVAGCHFFDDIGHNPVQLIAAARVMRGMYPHGAMGAFLLPNGYERLHAFGDSYAEALKLFDLVVLAPPIRNFEDSATTADESRFSQLLAAELLRRGVKATVRDLAEVSADDFLSCVAACFFGEQRMNGVLPGLLRPADLGS